MDQERLDAKCFTKKQVHKGRQGSTMDAKERRFMRPTTPLLLQSWSGYYRLASGFFLGVPEFQLLDLHQRMTA